MGEDEVRVHVGMYYEQGARFAEADPMFDANHFEEIVAVDMPEEMLKRWRQLRVAAEELFRLEKKINELPRLERADG